MEMQSETSARPLDLNAICRLCLSDRYDSLKSIFDEILGPNKIPQKAEMLLQIQISKHDKISTMVCNDCIIRLDTWFAYKRQCHINQNKLTEWLNIIKSGDELNETTMQIKQEPGVTLPFGVMPVKVEVNYDVDEYNDTTLGYEMEQNEHVYLEDLDINAVETDDDRRCPDCGKMFQTAQNRKRHQNMMHVSKERRAQMMEIPKSFTKDQTVLPKIHQGQNETPQPEPMDLEPSSTASTTDLETASTTDLADSKEKSDDISTLIIPENKQENANKTSHTVTEPDSSSEKTTDMDTSTLSAEGSEATDKATNENEPSASTETPTENVTDSTVNNEEKASLAVENKEENASPVKECEKKEVEKVDTKPNEAIPNTEDDEKKIQFAAGLRLVQRDALIESQPLSKIEVCYSEKCKATVSMFHTLQCACHNVQHKTIRHLLSHIRETRLWFPLFTCYNCMISLTDRSTFTKHYSKCPRPKLEALMKLSNIKKRSDVKSRLYQNFKCNRCKFLYSFHEDFCKHIDQDHAYGSPPFYCSCRYVFDSLEEYKTHCYTSCILSYYCDICFTTTSTLEEFVRHAEELHDESEGFVLLQENTYVPRPHMVKHKEADDESNVVQGKRERRKSTKEPIMVQIYDREVPPDLKEIPTRVIKKIIQLEHTPTTAEGWNKTPAHCPLCKKQYSSVNNMMRHYRTHIERKEVELPKLDDEPGAETEDLYTCPDCGGVYPSSKWPKHLEEKHPIQKCSDCDKEFQFQSELNQHRSVHLNIKVFRDSKTQAYKSAMVSPTSDSNGLPPEVMVMCEICDDVFKSKEELKNHKYIEHDTGGRSETSSALENSEIPDDEALDDEDVDGQNIVKEPEPQEVEKPWCENCNKPFASAKSLREHVINKHGSQFLKKNEYPKKCEYCDKMCATGAGFRIHVQMHERMNPADKNKSEFPKKCEYCDKMCTSGAGLYLHTQMHERVTLGELKKKKVDKKKSENFAEPEQVEESYHTCNRCFKVFGTKCKLKEHMKCHGINPKPAAKKNRKIMCNLCHISLDTPEEFEEHKAQEHGEELEGMPTLTNEMDVDEDTNGSDKFDIKPNIIYACDICENTFSSKPELRSHKEIHSKPKTKNAALICKYCKILFDSVNELTKHMHIEHEESAKPKITKATKDKDTAGKPFKCPICSKGFASHGAMTTHSGWHKRSAGPEENTPTGTAAVKMAKKAKVLKKVAAAAVNKQEPIDTPEFQCTTCFMELPNDTALQIHILEKHGNFDALMLIPRCNTCNQDFVTQEEYETHKRFHDFLERQKKHEKQKTIQTPVIQSVQSVAEPSPSNPKKFSCSWCNSVFSRQDTLNTHIKNNHKEHIKTNFECNHCHRVFDKQNSLTIHLKTHQKQKPTASTTQAPVPTPQVFVGSSGKVYVCSLCNMGFSFPKDLRMHTINAHPF